ncbi:MAG: hypothetical protein P9M06_07325 [Candidatus Saelkia tenebricola]|nr:hypothetical protein [Candidatus Saelkia tenebricola]
MRKILSIYTRLFGLWVLLGFLAAYFFPQIFIMLKPGMDWFFAFTMLGIGIVLNVDELKAVLKTPGIIVLGVLAQYSVMPLLAFLFTKFFLLSNTFSLGLILTGSAPGAMSSNVISYLARADVSYSVSLTTVSTLLSPVLTPFLTFVLARSCFEVNFWTMFLGIIKIVVLPLSVGIFLKMRFKKNYSHLLQYFLQFLLRSLSSYAHLLLH